MNESLPALRLANITKRFGKLVANDDISLDLGTGEVLALLGENGAGKSTMIKIINGAYVRDSGTIEFDGMPWIAGSPQQAQRSGISTIFQEINLIGYRSVAENVFLGREPRRAFGLLDWSRMNAEAAALLARFDVDVDVREPLERFSTAIQQMVVGGVLVVAVWLDTMYRRRAK